MLNGGDRVNSRRQTSEVVKALLSCLAEVRSLTVRRTRKQKALAGPDSGLDMILEVRSAQGRTFLVGQYKSVGQPRMARQAGNALLRATAALPDAYGVFMAPYVSPGAAEVCSELGIGHVDLAGNCRIAFGQVYISREGRPNPFAKKRDLRSLYSPKAERVLRVLLTKPAKAWKARPLAQEAEVSLGQVSNVKKLLADREWLKSGGDGIILSEPERLLAEWAENYNFRRNAATGFYSRAEAGEIESRLARACKKKGIACALTSFSGAIRLAPMVRYQQVTAYVSELTDELARDLDLKKVDSGANVSILAPYDEGVYYGTRTFGRAQVVSAVQVYLDLGGPAGRGKEAAEFLLQTEIRPTWQAEATTRRKR